MGSIVIIGTQWGDEGKGKIVDLLTQYADTVVRFQGGNNAGHTVYIGSEKFVFHLIPSGILYGGKRCVIGNGVVLDPEVFLKEVSEIKSRGYLKKDSQLLVSELAHLILPYHRRIDAARERSFKIGTTGRGIGPAYEDKVGRCGIRVVDLLNKDVFQKKLEMNLVQKNLYLERVLDEKGFDFDEIFEPYLRFGRELETYAADTSFVVQEDVRQGKRVLFEGAQGSLLDLEHGTYPFVTSSNTVAGNACAGSGVGPTVIDLVMGVSKAYTTRVGEGPFPTELKDETGERMRKGGGEFGATTGRPRRCGWFDAVVVNHAIRTSGVRETVITKLDVLSEFDRIRICTGYRLDGRVIDRVPPCVEQLERVEPVYEEMDGWKSDIRSVREISGLPAQARAYLRRLEELTGTRIGMVSTGPDRNETLGVVNPFEQL
jgi:adenylosuccinate synthase